MPLLRNSYYEYEKNDIKMREYHIDTYHKFKEMTPTMSVRCPPNSRPVMIVDRTRVASSNTAFRSDAGLAQVGR